VRVHVPALRQLSPDHRSLVESIQRLLPRLRGIQSVEPCFVTGNVLICYDPAVVSEGEVVACWHDLAGFVMRHRRALQAICPQELPALIDRLARAVQIPEGDGSALGSKNGGGSDAAS